MFSMIHNANENNNIEDEKYEITKYVTDKRESDLIEKSGYHHLRDESNPTQTHGLVTTVPQNIANLKIGDKHTPTRNSLRHSRMVVMNKTGRVPIEYLPPIIIHHDRAKVVMWIILIIGIIMSFECSILQVYAPNTKPILNPFYTAVPILCSGIFGIVHLSCCRKEYPGLRRNTCEKSIKVLSITTSLFGCATSIIYALTGLIHLLTFFIHECVPLDHLTNTCVCRIPHYNMVTSIFDNSWNYADLSCFEVYYVFNTVIGCTGFTCVLITVLEYYYLSLHNASRSTDKPADNYSCFI